VTTERNLTARSVVLSVLLGSDPPRLPAQLLVRTTELFGIPAGTTRTALSRMAAAGELRAEGGAYEIADPRLVARQARQTASRAARTRPWRGGRWVLAVVGAAGPRDAADRAGTRAALTAARLAEQREGVWLRPDNLERPAALAGIHTYTAVPDDDPTTLAATLWDLPGWASTAGTLRSGMAALVGRLDEGDTTALGPGFVVSAAVLRHFQHDPLLPDALLPAGWPGDALRQDYDRYDRAYRAVLRRWFRSAGDRPPQ
jgi:phenylacetic acid degradation operon negative regulatory protein